MKTIILSLIAISLLSAGNVNASNRKSTILENKIGNVKECIIFESKKMQPQKKTVYIYGENEIVKERVLYSWDKSKGWVALQKHEYEYEGEKLIAVICTKWDSKVNEWSEQSLQSVYGYDTSYKLLATNDVE